MLSYLWPIVPNTRLGTSTCAALECSVFTVLVLIFTKGYMPIKKNNKDFKQEDFKEIKLPPLSKFKGSKKYGGPWDIFQDYIRGQYGDELAPEVYQNLYLRKEEVDKFNTYIKDWMSKEWKGSSKRCIEMGIGMYNLDMAPIYFYCNPKWSKSGHMYIKLSKGSKDAIANKVRS